MPNKHENTERWGGPGSSHENASRPAPDDEPRDGRGRDEPTNTRFSGVSGGGGERDRHHAHDAKGKHDSEQNSIQRGKSGQH